MSLHCIANLAGYTVPGKLALIAGYCLCYLIQSCSLVMTSQYGRDYATICSLIHCRVYVCRIEQNYFIYGNLYVHGLHKKLHLYIYCITFLYIYSVLQPVLCCIDNCRFWSRTHPIGSVTAQSFGLFSEILGSVLFRVYSHTAVKSRFFPVMLYKTVRLCRNFIKIWLLYMNRTSNWHV